MVSVDVKYHVYLLTYSLVAHSRGLLRKTIDCLKEIHSRCAHNTTVTDELDRLYSVDSWQQGAQLLCEDADSKSNTSCVP